MLRRTRTIYVTLDPFLSPPSAVRYDFERFLAGLDEAEFPCIWLTSLTRAQLDEPRRRLGRKEPFIGESGCGVYLPEDYFHLKSRNTVRLGRFTCIPVAKPQPAAAQALEELSADLNISAVSLRSLSPRELSQNTGLPPKEAEQIRMRDFDELFFFAGTSESDIARFADEAKLRDLTLQNLGAFWSLSCGANLGQCIRELGGLYDRALRAHALRVGVAVVSASDTESVKNSASPVQSLSRSCDRTLLLTERQSQRAFRGTAAGSDPGPEAGAARTLSPDDEYRARHTFHLHSPQVWESVLAAILSKN